jgi:transcription elongation GreA/GreB family factor
VTYEDGDREERVVTTVGQDEVGLHRDDVSWVSPLAKD